MKYSVVMAVYKNDKPEWLCEALDSMLRQTCPPDEIIVVVDGSIPRALESTLGSYEGSISSIWLDENRGLWNALNKGIEAARNELIMRMDSDDISTLDRAKRQLREFQNNNDLAILSGPVAEFETSPVHVISHREVPLSHEEIVRFAKYRSPFNHPAVMFKKSAVMGVGGYAPLLRSEDYDLWIRMLMKGYKAKNLSSVVLYYRVGIDNAVRKSSFVQQKELLMLHGKYFKEGFLTLPQYLKACTLRISFGLMPRRLKLAIYKGVLRR